MFNGNIDEQKSYEQFKKFYQIILDLQKVSEIFLC